MSWRELLRRRTTSYFAAKSRFHHAVAEQRSETRIRLEEIFRGAVRRCSVQEGRTCAVARSGSVVGKRSKRARRTACPGRSLEVIQDTSYLLHAQSLSPCTLFDGRRAPGRPRCEAVLRVLASKRTWRNGLLKWSRRAKQRFGQPVWRSHGLSRLAAAARLQNHRL